MMERAETWRIGTVLGGTYRLDSIIGTGSVGTVFRAWHLTLEKVIAVKVIYTHLSANRTAVKRFEREARAASHLNHPNCIEVLDFGLEEDGAHYMVMEFVDGYDLAQLLTDEFPIGQARVVNIMRQVALALDLAHSEGIVHRDLKPENVMVTQSHRVHPDMVTVLDFGIAKLLVSSKVSKDSFQTLTGMVPGTPHYMSPEQARGEELDGRSDIYAIGVILYELITGQAPFDSPAPMRIIAMHLSQAPRPPRELFSNIFPDLEDLIMECLAKKRDARPADACKLAQRLEEVGQKMRRVPTSRASRAAASPGNHQRPNLDNELPNFGGPSNATRWVLLGLGLSVLIGWLIISL